MQARGHTPLVSIKDRTGAGQPEPGAVLNGHTASGKAPILGRLASFLLACFLGLLTAQLVVSQPKAEKQSNGEVGPQHPY